MISAGELPSDLEELRRKLTWRGDGPARGRVLSVFMDQNNRCNLKCKMCGFSDPRVSALPKYDMPRGLFDTIATQIFPQTNFLVLSILTEPFMTRDFPDRLERVREFEVPYSEIITNGTLLNETSIRKIIDAKITCLTFSIDGGTKETYEAIRVGARFQSVMYNLSLFQSMRRNRHVALPAVRMNHVLSEVNIDRFDDFLALAGKVRPERIGVRTVSRMSNALIQENREPEFWVKVGAARQKLAAFCGRTGIENAGYLRDRPTPIDLFTERGDRMICRAPWEALAIHPNGDIYPCMAWTRPPIGNLLRRTFDEIWTGEELESLRREFEDRLPGLDCLNCSIRSDTSPDTDDFFYRKVAKPFRSDAR
ncbi:MAG: radical SAM protein [Acidobacteriota bacterium]|nr:radical SAM protein [Acidobacteriota bacterium]